MYYYIKKKIDVIILKITWFFRRLFSKIASKITRKKYILPEESHKYTAVDKSADDKNIAERKTISQVVSEKRNKMFI